MDIHTWEVPVKATWQKSNTLVEFNYETGSLNIVVTEEETGQRWRIDFGHVAAFKVITDDYSSWSMQSVPPDGGFFTITESPWLTALGLAENDETETPRHHIICCQQEVIEVAAFGVTVAQE